MKRLLLLLALCLALSACSAPSKPPESSETSGLTVEEAREALARALLEQNPGFLSYEPETGFDAGDIHYIWSDILWNEDVQETTAEGTEIYSFDLCYGPDAGTGPDDAANPMAGRLLASYGISKDGERLWQYRQDLGEWEILT